MVQDSRRLFFSGAGGGFRMRFSFATKTTFADRAERNVFQDSKTGVFATPENDVQASQRRLAAGTVGAGIPPNADPPSGTRGNCDARTICWTHTNPVRKFNYA